MPSLLKLGVLCVLSEIGDLMGLPLVTALSCGDGTSTVKVSREGMANGRPALPVAEGGESPVDDGVMLSVCRRKSLVADVTGRTVLWVSAAVLIWAHCRLM